jgi:signal transduction histidine kinase
MNNIRKHAGASLVQVRLLPESPERFVLEVEDDGQGFDVAALFASYHERESLGMTSMKERTELAGGQMSIGSVVGQGTKVRFFFPTAPGEEQENS